MTPAPVDAVHRRTVLERARRASARVGPQAVTDLLAVLEAEFGPSELHVATPDGFVVAAASPQVAADLSLVADAAEQRRTTVGDGRLGVGTCLACPVPVGGRVVAVVAVSREGGWFPALATLADGVVAVATPCLATEQRRVLLATAQPTPCDEDQVQQVRRLVHDDAVQVLTAVAARLDLIRSGVLPEAELDGLAAQLRQTAARLAAGIGPGAPTP